MQTHKWLFEALQLDPLQAHGVAKPLNRNEGMESLMELPVL